MEFLAIFVINPVFDPDQGKMMQIRPDPATLICLLIGFCCAGYKGLGDTEA
jgi:hypothetical protein